MKIQSLSIVVPTKGCVNNCPCCVSKFDVHEDDYPNLIEKEFKCDVECLSSMIEKGEFDKKDLTPKNEKVFSLQEKGYFLEWTNKEDYIKRMQFARDNGCNIMLITASSGEALQNKPFLEKLAAWNQRLPKPFLWIEFQTTGVLLTDENLKFLKETLGVTTIALSVFNIYETRAKDSINADIIKMPKNLRFDFVDLCERIKKRNFNLRLSLNMSSITMDYSPNQYFEMAKNLGADQLTFRKLYKPNIKISLDHPKFVEIKNAIDWIDKYPVEESYIKKLNFWIKEHGKELEPLDFGPMRYSVDGVSTVLDDNCMVQSGQKNSVLRYLVLRENCKLYSRWDDPGSLVF